MGTNSSHASYIDCSLAHPNDILL